MAIEQSTDVSARTYDVVIVGAGIAGSILAKSLSREGYRILLLEAGTGQTLTYPGYLQNLETYYRAAAKVPNAPWPPSPGAPRPDVLDVRSNDPGANSQGYFVQRGPLPFRSDYARALGGTTLHWLGTCLRMLPEDLRLRSTYGVGLDWPFAYDDLRPYYSAAEQEIGVSADVEDQLRLGELLRIHERWFDDGYVYPMQRIPPSYLDQYLSRGIGEMTIDGEYFDGEYPVRVTSTPQGRNSTPNPKYQGGAPVGAMGSPMLGQRCQGNSSCVPICPVQAKYNAMKTLDVALRTARVDVVTQAVASRVVVDANGRVTEVVYKAYRDEPSAPYQTYVARGTIFVLAAHAVENAKLLLASGLGGAFVGKYLMDHPVLLTWGLAPEPLGTFRGPGSTSGIETLRGGAFRARRAAFRVEIDNWGWNWAAGAPWTDVEQLVYRDGLFGAQLRRRTRERVQRQVRLGFLLEQPPEASNCITIDPDYTDQLGNYRPIIQYDLADYTRAGAAAARATSRKLFARLEIQDYTSYPAYEPGFFTYADQPYVVQGAGHYVGGHVMGTARSNSVVNREQRVWDHENLFLVGCGNMPTEGTSNPTLTMAALTFMAAETLKRTLRQQGRRG